MISNLLRAVVGRNLPRSVKNRIRYILDPGLSLRWKSRSGCSFHLQNESDWCMFMEIFADGEYDRCITDLLDQAAPNAELTILDLGANVGFFVLRLFDLLSKSGRTDLRLHVISVEASKSVLVQIAPQLPESAKHHRVELIHGVVGLKTGSVTFHHSASSCEGSIFTGKGGAGRTEEIAYVDLDTILPPTRRIDLLKCDIEGAEEQFVSTYPDLLRKTDRLAIEFHHTLCNMAEVKNRLAAVGLKEAERGRQDDWAEVAYWTRIAQQGKGSSIFSGMG